jgi:hypothetical protein
LSDPKAIIVWGVNRTADGASDSTVPLNFSVGAGTDRGGTVSQWFCHNTVESGDLTAVHAAKGSGTDAILKMHGANDTDVASPTIDCELDLISMDSTSVVLDWINLHATASIVVHYMILGGSDITDAMAGQTTKAAATTQDVTVVAGFGQPDLLMFAGVWDAAGNLGNSDAIMSVGWGNKALEMGCQQLSDNEGATTVAMNHYQRTTQVIAFATPATTTVSYEGALAATSGWPTDGYELTWDNTGSSSDVFYWLALKGTFQSKIGQTTCPTTATTQDNACGFAPTAGVFWGGCLPAGTTVDGTHADLGQQWFGAWDGTNEGGALCLDDDNNANTRARVRQSTSKALVMATQAGTTQTLIADADASASGDNLRLTFTTAPAVGRAYLWMGLAGAAGGGTTYQPTGALTAGAASVGADVATFAEAGSVVADTAAAGADVFTASETGSLVPAAQLRGADVFTAAETGSLTPATFLAGTGTKAAEKSGSLVVGVFTAGADVFTAAETGTISTAGQLRGADVFEHNETGSLNPAAQLRGADAFQATEAGSLTPAGFIAGTDASTFNRLGSVTTGALLSGVAAKLGSYLKTGSLTVSVALSGPDVSTFNRLGSITPDTSLSGGKIREKTKDGSLTTAGQLRGADAFTSVETGSLTPAAFVLGGRNVTLNRTGALTIGTFLGGTSTYVPFLVVPIPAGWISSGRVRVLTRGRQGRIDQPEQGTVDS